MIDQVRPCVIMTATPIARDIARKRAQEPRRFDGRADQKPRLRQLEKADKRLLHTIQCVLGADAFTHHQPADTGAMLMHELRHPAKEAVLLLGLHFPDCILSRHETLHLQLLMPGRPARRTSLNSTLYCAVRLAVWRANRNTSSFEIRWASLSFAARQRGMAFSRRRAPASVSQTARRLRSLSTMAISTNPWLSRARRLRDSVD